jgi:hypothetical protein
VHPPLAYLEEGQCHKALGLLLVSKAPCLQAAQAILPVYLPTSGPTLVACQTSSLRLLFQAVPAVLPSLPSLRSVEHRDSVDSQVPHPLEALLQLARKRNLR